MRSLMDRNLALTIKLLSFQDRKVLVIQMLCTMQVCSMSVYNLPTSVIKMCETWIKLYIREAAHRKKKDRGKMGNSFLACAQGRVGLDTTDGQEPSTSHEARMIFHNYKECQFHGHFR